MNRLTMRKADGSVSQPMNLDWGAVLERLAAYEDTGLEPGEITQDQDKYKALYINLLKAKDDDICGKCTHQRHCDGKTCPGYIEGRGGKLDGQWVDFRWTCEDLDWGSCPMMEDTPCHGCFDGGYCRFELKEERDG